MSAYLLSLNQSKTDVLLIGLPKQLFNVSNAAVLMPSNGTSTPSDSARNLGVIFDSSLTVSDHISSVFNSCIMAIRGLRRIRNTLYSVTVKTIATSLILR